MAADKDKPHPRGLFIVLEGLDRCGKSTQVDRLVARLNAAGRQARLQKFPGKSNELPLEAQGLAQGMLADSHQRPHYSYWSDDQQLLAITV